MSSWRGPNGGVPSENGPRAKCDQVIFEAMAKAAEVIVGSRCWIDSSGSTSPASGSSRFNLLVPEIQGVRSILQRWKRSLHVPLRLDVYFQHPDQRRELLERWCLEYVPSHFQQQLETHSSDPIVQLRYVCKKIVIWLRTLYCMCRMLPSQSLRGGTVGFSIYVVSEGNEDVNMLVSNQGFKSQQQPACVVTPYGELAWKVFYANKEVVDMLLPDKSPYKTQARPIPTRSMRIAVPTSNTNTTQTKPVASPRAAQSAPQHGRNMYHRSASAANAYESPRNARQVYRSNSLVSDKVDLNDKTTAHGSVPNHSNNDEPQHFQKVAKNVSALSGSKPTKTLSGLSLAMMMSDDNTYDSNDKDEKIKPTAEQAEKRRAALHHAPPQLLTTNSNDAMPTVSSGSPGANKSLVGAGEYGYAYNSHIPWQQQTKGSNNGSANASYGNSIGNNRPSMNDAHDRAASPSTFQIGTPPTGVLGATPPGGGGFLGGATPPVVNSSSLIPPRSSGTVTPPFVRALGFATEPPPTAPELTSQLAQPSIQHPVGAGSTSTPNQTNPAKAPVTSLDLLHSSPFQQAPGGSLVSSISLHEHGNLNSFLGSQMEAPLHPYEDHYRPNRDDDDDMPFAVDPHHAASESGVTGSSHLASSSAVASFAQRCGTASRLSLFDSTDKLQDASEAQDDMVASLAEQLAEFKSFGASLMLDKSGSETGSAGGAIALRP